MGSQYLPRGLRIGKSHGVTRDRFQGSNWKRHPRGVHHTGSGLRSGQFTDVQLLKFNCFKILIYALKFSKVVD